MAKLIDLGVLPPTDPIFQEPWTVRPMPARSREEPTKAQEAEPPVGGEREPDEGSRAEEEE